MEAARWKRSAAVVLAEVAQAGALAVAQALPGRLRAAWAGPGPRPPANRSRPGTPGRKSTKPGGAAGDEASGGRDGEEGRWPVFQSRAGPGRQLPEPVCPRRSPRPRAARRPQGYGPRDAELAASFAGGRKALAAGERAGQHASAQLVPELAARLRERDRSRTIPSMASAPSGPLIFWINGSFSVPLQSVEYAPHCSTSSDEGGSMNARTGAQAALAGGSILAALPWWRARLLAGLPVFFAAAGGAAIDPARPGSPRLAGGQAGARGPAPAPPPPRRPGLLRGGPLSASSCSPRSPGRAPRRQTLRDGACAAITALLSALLLKERIGRRAAAGITLAAAGIALLESGGMAELAATWADASSPSARRPRNRYST